MPKITIVDENDKIIGAKDRDALSDKDIYRVSSLWVTNSRGEILLARRHRDKIHDPRKWGPAVAGTVEEGETYEDNIIKEAAEELGLKNIQPNLGPKVKVDNKYHYFGQRYILSIDKDISEFKIQEDEVEEIKWFSPRELKEQLKKHPEEFSLSVKSILDYFYGKK